jgi:protein-arginine kinase activator protein McsA
MTKGKVLIDGDFKVCSSCKDLKSFSAFHKDKSSPSGLAYYCKDCANSKSRLQHKSSSEDGEWLNSRRAKMRGLSRDRKSKAVAYKGGACEDCKQTYPDYIYDFHHLCGDMKTDNPSAILRRGWEAAKLELDQCALLCANCHRERHYGKR